MKSFSLALLNGTDIGTGTIWLLALAALAGGLWLLRAHTRRITPNPKSTILGFAPHVEAPSEPDVSDKSKRLPGDEPYRPEEDEFVPRVRKLPRGTSTDVRALPPHQCSYCGLAFTPDNDGDCNNCGASL